MRVVPSVRHGVARITVQPGLPTASIIPPRYPSPVEISVRIGFVNEYAA